MHISSAKAAWASRWQGKRDVEVEGSGRGRKGSPASLRGGQRSCARQSHGTEQCTSGSGREER
eukprot:5015219-Pyramimonas_sp.AAC.1